MYCSGFAHSCACLCCFGAGAKVHTIDDLTASRINDAVGVTEKLSYDTLDMLFDTLREVATTCEV